VILSRPLWSGARAARLGRRGASHAVLAALVSVLCALAALAPASALALNHGFTGAFGSETTTPANPYPLSNPSGVAVNEVTSGDVGDVYVVDKGNNRVEVFNSSGAFVLMFGKEVNKTKVEAAAPEAEQNVCSAASGNTCQAGTEGSSPGEFSSPESIAIDNSGNAGDPSDGDVYVVNKGDNTIQKFSAEGAYIGQLSETESGSPFGSLDGVAVSPSGDVWVFQEGPKRFSEFSDALTNTFLSNIAEPERSGEPGFAVDSEGNFYINTGAGEIAKFSSSGVELINGMDGGAATGVAVNLDSSSSEYDEVYIDNLTSVAVFNMASACTVATPCPGRPPAEAFVARFGSERSLRRGSGIAVDGATGIVYVADAGKNDVDIFGFGSPPNAPTTEAATGVTHESATLNGTLTSGSEKVNYFFTYKLGDICTSGETTSPGEAESNATESASISGLEPSAEYTVCMTAENEFGATQGVPKTFETEGVPPTAETGGVSELTNAGATLHGEVDPFNQETEYSFEYSTEQSLGHATTVQGSPNISAHLLGEQQISAPTGAVLLPETTYYYRVVAQNGTSSSTAPTIQSFTTAPPLPTVTTEGASQITTASATLAGSVVPGSAGPYSDTTWSFQYGTDTTYSSGSVPATPGDAGIGTSRVPVSTGVEGLASNTAYHYRLVASNANDDPGVSPQFEYGADRTFTTAPLQPFPGESSHLSETAATLSGDVDPDGHALEYRFEYGTSTAYGQSTTVSPAAETDDYTTVNAPVSGLTPGIPYHYRLVAIGAGGESYSPDATFTLYSTATPEQTGDPFAPGQSTPAPFPTLPLLGTPTFPPPPSEPSTTTTKKLTRAEKLAKALEQCKRDKSKRKRKSCEKAARHRYGVKSKKTGGKR
jgi:hypothetical protein